MTAVTLGRTTHAVPSASTRAASDPWRIAALSLLSVRFIQGFIYWGGGSRRFIYAPSKLDPHAASWMANKFQSAMPGALLGGVLIGLTEAMAGLFFTPSAKSMFSFGLLVLVLLFRPQGILGKKAS